MAKARESGMPDEATWAGFFTPECVLDALELAPGPGDIVEFGCGYGTFTLPAARRCAGTVHALDIDPEMVARTEQLARAAGLGNVRTVLRDFLATGTGLAPQSVRYAMLFNILHAESPQVLLEEAARVLAPGGLLGIMHWNYDKATPRGPSMEIRPRPEQCERWAIEAGFEPIGAGVVALPPYHWGLVLRKPGGNAGGSAIQ